MHKTELKILIGLHRVTNAIDRQSARVVAEYDLTMGQFAVLEALYHKGDMTVGQVQEKILSSTGTMPLIIKNLVKRNFVEKTVRATDRRCSDLHLTEAGRRVIEQAYPKNEESIVHMMRAWNRQEKELMATLLKKLGDDIHAKNGTK